MISPWCNSAAKRAFDIVLAVLLLAPALPLMIIVGLLVKVSSRGPALYRHFRPGKNGREFEILKFRTMRHMQGEAGPALTRTGDPRVTPVGNFLRKSKLDELPQLFNVLRGEMSFVGPRPQPTKLWQHYNELPAVLAVAPGITGAATLAFRHEEDILCPLDSSEIESIYIDQIMPLKMKIDMEYLKTATLRSDMVLILRTALSILQRHPEVDNAEAASVTPNQSAPAGNSDSFATNPRKAFSFTASAARSGSRSEVGDQAVDLK